MGLIDDLGSPQYRVQLVARGGKLEDITGRVTKVTHADTSKETPSLEISVDNGDDYVLRHPELMRKGLVFEVDYGYPSQMRKGLRFISKGCKGNSQSMQFTALEQKQSKISRKEVLRVWSDVTRSGIVREILSRDGIPASQQFVDDTAERFTTITQTTNDFAFLLSLASSEGFECYPDSDGFHWHAPKRSARPSHSFRYVKGLVAIGVISDYSVDSFSAGRAGKVRLRGRNPKTKKTFDVVAESATVNVAPLGDASDLRSPEEGDAKNGGNDGFEVSRNCACRTEAEARKLAEAIYKDYRFSALKLSVTTAGDPTLRKGNVIALWGLGPAMDGTYYLRDVNHAFDATYTSQLTLSRDGPAKADGRALDREAEQFLDSETSLDWTRTGNEPSSNRRGDRGGGGVVRDGWVVHSNREGGE